jgi:hypothetical protein
MESATERNDCYKCHKPQQMNTMCSDCHGKMIQQMKRDLAIKGACCDYNGTEYWY